MTEASVVEVPCNTMSKLRMLMNGHVAQAELGQPVVASSAQPVQVLLLPPVQYCCNGMHRCTGVTTKLLIVKVLLSVIACQLVLPWRYCSTPEVSLKPKCSTPSA